MGDARIRVHVVWIEDSGVKVLHLEHARPYSDIKYLNELHDKVDFRDVFSRYLQDGYVLHDIESKMVETGVDYRINASYKNLNEYAEAIRGDKWHIIDYVYFYGAGEKQWSFWDRDAFANMFTIPSSSIMTRYKVHVTVEVNALSGDAASLMVRQLLKDNDSEKTVGKTTEKDRGLSVSIKKVERVGEAKKRG